MQDIIKRTDEVFNAIDESLIQEVLEPKIAETISKHYQTLEQAGLKGDALIKGLAAACVVESVRLSAFIASLLMNIDPDKPINPRDFIHLVK